MRLGTLSESQGLGIVGPLPPTPDPGQTEIVNSTIYWGDVLCRDANGQLIQDPAQCADQNVYTMQGGQQCFSGYGPPPAGSVYCATGCGTGQAWDPYSQSCKTIMAAGGVGGGTQWVPGISNNILLAGAALIAVLALTGGRR